MDLRNVSFTALETPCAFFAHSFPDAHAEPHSPWTAPDGTKWIEYRFRTIDGLRHVVRVSVGLLSGKSDRRIESALQIAGLDRAVRTAAGRTTIYVGHDGAILNA